MIRDLHVLSRRLKNPANSKHLKLKKSNPSCALPCSDNLITSTSLLQISRVQRRLEGEPLARDSRLNDAQVLVVVADGEIVGSGYAKVAASSGYRLHDVHAYLGFMYVKPDVRGQGVNQLILDGLLDWARSRDIFEIQLEVYPDNEAAMRAYTKAGFTPHLLRMRLDSRKR